MNPEIMEKTRDARDFAALTEEIVAACEGFGPIHCLKLVHNRGTSSVACTIELEAQKQQPALARALGARALSGSVCLEIPVRRDFQSGNRGLALAPRPAYQAQAATR